MSIIIMYPENLITAWGGAHLATVDPYVAAAIHPYVGKRERQRLEPILFIRNRLRWARETSRGPVSVESYDTPQQSIPADRNNS